jgi:hypothetical protein
LYLVIRSISFASGIVPGAAFSYPFGITSIMKRIAVSLSLSPGWKVHMG